MNHKRAYFYFVVLLFIVFLMPCEYSSAASKKVKLSKKDISVNQGETYKIKLKSAKGKNIKWYSTNKRIATVKKGLIKARKKGRCIVIAKYAGKKFKCKVRVKSVKNSSNKQVPNAVLPMKQNVATNNNSKGISFGAQIVQSNENVLSLRIRNCFGTDVVMGEYFTLEYYDGEKWVSVKMKDDCCIKDIAIIINNGAEYRGTINLNQYFSVLSKGRYRIKKQIYMGNSQITIQAEFLIG